MKLFIALVAVVLLAGCATERQMSFGPVPIYRIESSALHRKVEGYGIDVRGRIVMGLFVSDPMAIYYSSSLDQMQSIGNVIHEGIGHMHVYLTGDSRIWDTIDMLAATDPYGMLKFPVASDRHPSKQVFSWDKSEYAQEVRAIYAATVEARKSGGEY